MTEPIRVLHVFGALDSGGVSNFVMNVYRHIDRTRFQFDFAMTSGKTGLFDEQVLAMGGRIFYFDPARSLLDNLPYCERMARLRRCTAMCFSIPDLYCVRQSTRGYRCASPTRTMRTRVSPAACRGWHMSGGCGF